MLFRTSEENNLKFWGREKSNVFSSQFIVIFFMAMLLLLFYLGGSWQKSDIMQGLVKTQLFLIVLPTFLVLRVSRSNIPRVMRFNKTNPFNYIFVILIALPALLTAIGVGNLSQSDLPCFRNLSEINAGPCKCPAEQYLDTYFDHRCITGYM